jgi:hypothetical protein
MMQHLYGKSAQGMTDTARERKMSREQARIPTRTRWEALAKECQFGTAGRQCAGGAVVLRARPVDLALGCRSL